MNCKDVKELLLSYLDDEVSPEEQKAIQAHLSACPHCRNEVEALADTQMKLRQAFKTTAARVSPSPQAWATIKQRLMRGEHHKIPIFSLLKSKVRGVTEGLKAPRPVWQTTLVSVLGIVLIIALCLTTPLLLHQPTEQAQAQFKRFSSYEEMKAFLNVNPDSYRYNSLRDWGTAALDAAEGKVVLAPSVEDYSTTNIQVEGVDEADIIKTDGEFIYLVSDTKVIIAKAYPAEKAQVLAEIKLDERIDGIFINGDRLVVIHQNWNDWVIRYEGFAAMPELAETLVPQTYIKVYDVSDKANPVVTRDMSIDGNYVGSRMAGDYVYVIINASLYEQDGEVELPVIHLGGTDVKVDATDIYYTDIADYYYSVTTIAAVNVEEDDQEPKYESVLLGATSNLYVSLNNIYVTSTVWSGNSEKTAIHRIRTSGGEIAYEASGEIPGTVLNQFSMDEYQGFFRVATTTTSWGEVRTGIAPESISANHVYILDMNLSIVSSLKDLAPGEQIYSARFIDNRGYLVTFKKTDPLFVIDLKNPYEPKVLGQLKISGYSDYLQPYDENHLLGIGKEAMAADGGDFAWYQGVKISLFDVSDVKNPKEIAKYEIGDRGTDSPVLRDHKALLFDKAKNLLVIPVWLAEINEAKYPYGEIPSYAYGEIVWQGAYVFDISIDGGLQLKGRITHYDDPSQVGNYYYGANSVQRSLYIDNVLYTISEAKIKMNSLEDLSYINELVLP